MPFCYVPRDEVELRIARLQSSLQHQGIDGVLMVQGVDVAYFSGTPYADFVYLPAEGEPLILYEQSNAQREPSCEYLPIKRIEDIPGVLEEAYGRTPSTLGLELDVVSAKEFEVYSRIFDVKRLVDASPLILKVRAIKSEWELEQMGKAAQITRQVFENIRSVIRPGLTEMELAAKAEAHAQCVALAPIDIRVRDYKTEGYPWHVLSGKSGGMVGLLDSPTSGEGTSAAFPCGAGFKPIGEDEPVMVDFAYELNGYHMDETRMFCVGTMSDLARKAAEAAIEIHDWVLEHVRPGVAVGELFEHSVAKARELGYEEEYLGPLGYKVNFVGHGIGAELVEYPVIAGKKEDELRPGMTFALEPKIVFKDQFIAGVESVFTVTERGYQLISQVPVEIFIC